MKINHALIISSNLENTNHFWTQIFGLELGDRPPFPFKGSWLYNEGEPIIHVAAGSVDEYARSAIDHIALEGADYSTLIESLQRNDVEYKEADVPLTGEHQVFVTAPDDVEVEILFSAQ